LFNKKRIYFLNFFNFLFARHWRQIRARQVRSLPFLVATPRFLHFAAVFVFGARYYYFFREKAREKFFRRLRFLSSRLRFLASSAVENGQRPTKPRFTVKISPLFSSKKIQSINKQFFVCLLLLSCHPLIILIKIVP
jgi:hypothetical protein